MTIPTFEAFISVGENSALSKHVEYKGLSKKPPEEMR